MAPLPRRDRGGVPRGITPALSDSFRPFGSERRGDDAGFPLRGRSLSLVACDALVVGGGPGGSSAAWALGRAGLDVLVLDKAAFPRDKPCAGWVTPQVFEEREIDPADYRRGGRTLQAITAFRTGMIGARARTTSWGRTVSWGIRRREFDAYLLERSSARARTGEGVTSIRREGAHFVVNGTYVTRLLVGAGGHFCPVARFLRARVGQEPAIAAQELEFRMDEVQRAACPVEAAEPELYFCPDLKGYGWCFRKGDFLNVGLGRDDRKELPRRLGEFVSWLQQEGRLPAGLPAAWKGHAYLLFRTTPRRPFDDGVLLVGDAAGLAYSESGEGIRTAVESGLLAARTILAADGDYRGTTLAAYASALDARFGPRPSSERPTRRLPAGLVRRLASVLVTSRIFARHVLLERWFLHAHHPALAPSA